MSTGQAEMSKLERELRDAGGTFVRLTANNHRLWRLGKRHITLYASGEYRNQHNQRQQVHRLIRAYRAETPIAMKTALAFVEQGDPQAAKAALLDFERVEPHEPFVAPTLEDEIRAAKMETAAERAGRQETEWFAGNGPFDAAGPLGTSASEPSLTEEINAAKAALDEPGRLPYDEVRATVFVGDNASNTTTVITPTQEEADMGKKHAGVSARGTARSKDWRHAPKKPHAKTKCPECERTFTWAPGLAIHLKHKHGVKTTTVEKLRRPAKHADLVTTQAIDGLVEGLTHLTEAYKRLFAENTDLKRQMAEMAQALSLVANVQERAKAALRQR